MSKSVTVVNNERKSRFEARVEGGAEEDAGVAHYRKRGSTMEFTSTEVPPSLRGAGVGSALARAGLEHARGEGMEVVPTCPFIKRYMDRHPEYRDLLPGSG